MTTCVNPKEDCGAAAAGEGAAGAAGAGERREGQPPPPPRPAARRGTLEASRPRPRSRPRCRPLLQSLARPAPLCSRLPQLGAGKVSGPRAAAAVVAHEPARDLALLDALQHPELAAAQPEPPLPPRRLPPPPPAPSSVAPTPSPDATSAANYKPPTTRDAAPVLRGAPPPAAASAGAGARDNGGELPRREADLQAQVLQLRQRMRAMEAGMASHPIRPSSSTSSDDHAKAPTTASTAPRDASRRGHSPPPLRAPTRRGSGRRRGRRGRRRRRCRRCRRARRSSTPHPAPRPRRARP